MPKNAGQHKKTAPPASWKEDDLEAFLMGTETTSVPLRGRTSGTEKLVFVMRHKVAKTMTDLIFLDHEAKLVLIEVKNEKATRTGVGQAFEYLAGHRGYGLPDLLQEVQEIDEHQNLQADFAKCFNKPLNKLHRKRRVILIAPHFSVSASVACAYLNEKLGKDADFTMLRAQLVDGEFCLNWHPEPDVKRASKVKEGMYGFSEGGNRLFCVVESGTPSVVWWVGRFNSSDELKEPTNKKTRLIRSNRYIVDPQKSAVEVDISKQGTYWRPKTRNGKAASKKLGKRIRLLGFVKYGSTDKAVFVKWKSNGKLITTSRDRTKFEAEWTEDKIDEPLQSWQAITRAIASQEQIE